MDIPDEIHKLFEEYQKKYGKAPRRFNNDQWNSLDEYKNYLLKEMEK